MNSSYFSNNHILTSEGLSNLLLPTFSKNIQITNSSDITTNSSNKTIDQFKSAVLKIKELYGINKNKSQSNLRETIYKKKFFDKEAFKITNPAENMKEKLKKINKNINCDQPSQNYQLNQGNKAIELPNINKINLSSFSEEFGEKLATSKNKKRDISNRKSMSNLTTAKKIDLSLNNKNKFLIKKKVENSKNIEHERSHVTIMQNEKNIFLEKNQKEFDEIFKTEEKEKEMGYLSLMRIPKKKKKNLEFVKGVFEIRIDLKSEKNEEINKNETKVQESNLDIESDRNLIKDGEDNKPNNHSCLGDKNYIETQKNTGDVEFVLERENEENHSSKSEPKTLLIKEKKLSMTSFTDSKAEEFKEEIKSKKSLTASIPSSTSSKLRDLSETNKNRPITFHENSLKIKTDEKISEVEELKNNDSLNDESVHFDYSKDESMLIEENIEDEENNIKKDRSILKFNIENQLEKDNSESSLPPPLQLSRDPIPSSQKTKPNLDKEELLLNEDPNIFNVNQDQSMEVDISKINTSQNQILSQVNINIENSEVEETPKNLKLPNLNLIQNNDDSNGLPVFPQLLDSIKENSLNNEEIKIANYNKNNEISNFEVSNDNQTSILPEKTVIPMHEIVNPPKKSEDQQKKSVNLAENPLNLVQNAELPTYSIVLPALPPESRKISLFADNEFNSNSSDRRISLLTKSLNAEIIDRKESFLSDYKLNFDQMKNENDSGSQDSIQKEKENVITRNEQESFQGEENEAKDDDLNQGPLKESSENKQQEDQMEKESEEKNAPFLPSSFPKIKILSDPQDRDSHSDLNFSSRFSNFNAFRKSSKQLQTPKNFLISPGSRLSTILKKQESFRRGSVFTMKLNGAGMKRLSMKPNEIIPLNEEDLSSDDSSNQSESEESEESYEFRGGRSGRFCRAIEIIEENGGSFNEESELNLEKRWPLLIESYSLREDNIRDSKMRRFLKFQSRFLKNLESDYNLFRNIYDINSEFNTIQRTDRRESIGSQEWIESPIASELIKLNRFSSSYNDVVPISQCGLERLDSSSRDKEIHNSCHSEKEEKHYNFQKCLAYKKREKDIFYIYSDFLKNMSYFNAGSTQNLIKPTNIPEKYVTCLEKRDFCVMVSYDQILEPNDFFVKDTTNIPILSEEKSKSKKEDNYDETESEHYSVNYDSDQYDNEEELKFRCMNKLVPMELKIVSKKQSFSKQSIDDVIIPIISGLHDELKNQLIEQKIMMLDHGSVQIENENNEYYQKMHHFRKKNKKAFEEFEIKYKRKNEFNKLLGSWFEDNIPILAEKIPNRRIDSLQEIFNNHRRKPRIIPLLPFDKTWDPESPNYHKKSIYLTDRLNNILHSSGTPQYMRTEALSEESNLRKKPGKLKRDKAKRNLELPQNNHRATIIKKSVLGVDSILSLKLPDSYRPPPIRSTRRNTKPGTILKIQEEFDRPEKTSQISSETNININFHTNKKKVSDFETKEQSVFVQKFREQNEKMDQRSLFLRTQIVSLDRLREYDPIEQIIWAISHHNVYLVEELFISYPGVLVDELDNQRNSFLMLAAQIGSQEIVNLLLMKGANVNLQNNEGNSALHLSLAFLNDEISDKLIAFGANENTKNMEGKTPWEMYVKRQALVV